MLNEVARWHDRLAVSIDSIRDDLRQAGRSLLRSPSATVTSVLTLALGIGACTAVFSVVSAVLLAPLPYPTPDRLFHLVHRFEGTTFPGVTAPEFFAWRESMAGAEDAAAYRPPGVMNLTSGAQPEQVVAARASARFFALLGARFEAGRGFTEEEDTPNGPPAVVVTHRFQARQLSDARDVIGKTVLLDGRPHAIVGVLGDDFDPRSAFPIATLTPDVWVPLALDPASVSDAHNIVATARLRPGVSRAVAEAQTAVAESAFRTRYPGTMPTTMGLTVTPLDSLVSGSARSSLLLLLAAVALLLTIVCANVAGLQLVRMSARPREFAIRAAMGASRGRLARLILAESLIAAVFGGAAGILLGVAGMRMLLAIQPGNIPRIVQNGSDVPLDWRVALFALAISLAAAIASGFVPAWFASRRDLTVRLTGRGGQGESGRRRARTIIVATEIALATMLLACSVLLVRSVAAIQRVDPGFDASGVLALQVAATESRYATTAAAAALADAGERALAALPGAVTAAATLTEVPLDGDSANLKIEVVGGAPEASLLGSWRIVTPDWFAVLRIPLVRGRLFSPLDRAGSEPVVVVNHALARRLFPQGDALNGRLLLGRGAGPEFKDAPRRIVGVVGDARQAGLNRDPRAAAYVPFAQLPDAGAEFFNRVSGRMTWLVRTSDAHPALAALARERLRTATGIPVPSVRTMTEVARASTSRTRFEMWVMVVFGLSAVFLAALGVYGVAAVAVQQRTREIGIRLALGATGAAIRRNVINLGMAIAAGGVAIGVAGGLAGAQLLAGFVFGISPRDGVAFAVAPAILLAIALAANWLPARRAMRIDPAITLRVD